MLASFRLRGTGHWEIAAAAAIEECAQRALLGVYLIFHMPQQLLLQQQQQEQTAQWQQRLLATAVAMSTAYTSGLATTTGGVGRKLRSQVCPLA